MQPSDRGIVGDQACHLSVLMQQGYPVLAEGVITTIAFEQFLSAIAWLAPLFALPNLASIEARQQQAIARQIRHEIEATPLIADWLPELWSAPALLLRPQIVNEAIATANDWLAPQICWAEPDAIATAIKRVWGEVFRAKSLLFWQRSNLPISQIRLTVLVQPVSAAIASGQVRLSATEKMLQGQRGLGGVTGLMDAVPIDLLNPQSIASTHQLQLSHDRQSDCLELQSSAGRSPILDSAQIQQLMQMASAIASTDYQDYQLEWLLTDAPQPQFWLTQVLPMAETRPIGRSIDPEILVRGLAASAGRIIGTAWVMEEHQIPTDLPADAILVAARLSMQALHVKQVSGFAIEQGSLTSHSAIIARELGIPAIVGATNATRQIQTGDRVCLDGDRGLLYRIDSESHLAAKPVIPAATLTLPDAQAPALMVNLSQTVTLEQIAHLPIAGVGLLRSELLLVDLLQAPASETSIATIADRLRPFVETLYPRPVYYRSLDRAILASELNPLLGLHGAFSYQLDGSWFERELLALRQLQQEGFDNLHLLLPFVRTIEEFRWCRSQVEQAGLMQPTFQLWIMAEVPSVLFLLPDYVAAGAQGIAIGSNDLTQLLLGIDRDQPQFAAAYSQMHPAVLQAIHQLIQTARQLKIPCSICGQAPSLFPELIASLVGWGITAISVEPSAIEATARAIATQTASTRLH